MRDAVVLSELLKEKGFGQQTIAEYEKDMLPYAADVITRSNMSGKLFFDFDSPKTFLEYMSKNPLIQNMKD